MIERCLDRPLNFAQAGGGAAGALARKFAAAERAAAKARATVSSAAMRAAAVDEHSAPERATADGESEANTTGSLKIAAAPAQPTGTAAVQAPTGAGGAPKTKKWGARKSQYVGVRWIRGHQKWRATIQTYGVKRVLGEFDAEDAAARAIDAYVIENQIDRYLNFPDAPGAVNHETSNEVQKTTQFHGLIWNRHGQHWQAWAIRVGLPGKRKFINTFKSEEDAARAVDDAIAKCYRNKTRPFGWPGWNFPSERVEEEALFAVAEDATPAQARPRKRARSSASL